MRVEHDSEVDTIQEWEDEKRTGELLYNIRFGWPMYWYSFVRMIEGDDE
jgi:hypothetical protein